MGIGRHVGVCSFLNRRVLAYSDKLSQFITLPIYEHVPDREGGGRNVVPRGHLFSDARRLVNTVDGWIASAT